MFAQATLLPACLLLVGFSSSALAAGTLGTECSSAVTCTDANTQCEYTTGCKMGTCVCVANYVAFTTGGATSCKKVHDQACSAPGDCGYANAACTSSKCACATGYTYSFGICVEDAKAWGETCGTNDVDADCHVVAAAGGECDGTTKCNCKTKYTQTTGYICKAPVLDDECDGTVDVPCGKRGDVDGIPVETAPVCTSSKCVCAGGDEEHTLDGKKYCTSAAPANLLPEGTQCVRNNECESDRCKTCPGAGSQKSCVEEDSNGGVAVAVQPVVMLALTIIVGVLTF